MYVCGDRAAKYERHMGRGRAANCDMKTIYVRRGQGSKCDKCIIWGEGSQVG